MALLESDQIIFHNEQSIVTGYARLWYSILIIPKTFYYWKRADAYIGPLLFEDITHLALRDPLTRLRLTTMPVISPDSNLEMASSSDLSMQLLILWQTRRFRSMERPSSWTWR